MAIALCLALLSPAQATLTAFILTPNTNAIPRYDLHELTMTEGGSYANPWEDVAITAVFTSPSSNAHTVGGFYYDTGTWKLRFAPMETGTWTWALTFTNGQDSLTTNGSFVCTPSSNSGFLRRHPAILRHFITEGDGKPFYANGFNKPPYYAGTVTRPDFGQQLDNGVSASLSSWLGAYRAAGLNMIRDNAQAVDNLNQFNVVGDGKNTYRIAEGKLEDQYYQVIHQQGYKLLLDFWKRPDPTPVPGYVVTNAAVKLAVENYHRYMLNRFSAYADIWEFGNELQNVTQSYLDTVVAVCASNDPYRHPLTISFYQRALDESALTVCAGSHRYTPLNNLALPGIASSCSTLHGWYPDDPLLFGEAGNTTPFGHYDPERYRISIWAAFCSEAANLFWMVLFDRNPCVIASITNEYMGPEERGFAKIFANFVADFDPLATNVTATLNPANQMTASVLGSSQDLIGYLTHSTSHNTTLSGAKVTLAIPANGMQGQWIDPSTGATLQTFTVNSGSQVLTIPNFAADIVFRIRATAAVPRIEFGTANLTVRENQGAATVTVTRAGSAAGAVSVDYATGDGLAVAGRHYTAATGTLTWADGDLAPKSVAIPLLDNNLFDGDRDVRLTLSHPSGGAVLGNNNTALITIYNDDIDQLNLSATGYAVLKNAGSVAITINRVGRGVGPVAVSYNTVNGSAGNTDYTPQAWTPTTVPAGVAWADGDLAPRQVVIPILNNLAASGCKTFRFELVDAQGTTFGLAYRATVTIIDPGAAQPGILQFGGTSHLRNPIGSGGYCDVGYAVARTAGSAIIPVSRVGGSNGTVSVNYTNAAGNAVVGADFTPVGGTLSWTDGDAADKYITVPLLNNASASGHVVTFISLSAPTGGAFLNNFGAGARAPLLIVDPNLPPVITSTQTATGMVGSAFSYAIAAATATTNFSAANLPAGLSVNPATGVIAGTPGPGSQGTYAVVLGATNAGGAGSSYLMLTISPAAAIAPVIVVQPADAAVTNGQSVTFSVGAAGALPLSYQWKRGGAAITNAVGSCCSIVAPALNDNGATFSVVVSNRAGVVTSSNAVLTVTPGPVPPSVTVHPVGRNVVLGSTVVLSVAAAGTAPLSYQWSRNGAPVDGAQSSFYAISPATLSESGAVYAVTVANAAGTVTSSNAVVAVSAGMPVLTTLAVAPASVNTLTGTAQQFSATAKDQYGSDLSPQPVFAWTISGGGAIDTNGLFTAGGTTGGPYLVTAASGGVTGTASVTVFQAQALPVLTTVTVTPSTPACQPGPASFLPPRPGTNSAPRSRPPRCSHGAYMAAAPSAQTAYSRPVARRADRTRSPRPAVASRAPRA